MLTLIKLLGFKLYMYLTKLNIHFEYDMMSKNCNLISLKVYCFECLKIIEVDYAPCSFGIALLIGKYNLSWKGLTFLSQWNLINLKIQGVYLLQLNTPNKYMHLVYLKSWYRIYCIFASFNLSCSRGNIFFATSETS